MNKETKIHAVCQTFNEIQAGPNPLTLQEVNTLVAARPEIYGVLAPLAKAFFEMNSEDLYDFHVGELAYVDMAHAHATGGTSPLVILVERQACGLLWRALFPNGTIYQTTASRLSKAS